GFDLKKPAILVYLRHGQQWQLGALEWVFPEETAHPPVPGATYGIFLAARAVRDLPRRGPLRRRHLHAGEQPVRVRADEPAERSEVQFLASAADHPARVALVPEPCRDLLGDEPTRDRLRPQLNAQDNR